MTTEPTPTPHRSTACAPFQTPQYRQVQSLFSTFINNPTDLEAASALSSALNEFELMARLRQVIPA